VPLGSAGHRVPLAYCGCNFAWPLLTKGGHSRDQRAPLCRGTVQTLSPTPHTPPPGSPLPITAAYTNLATGYVYTPFALCGCPSQSPPALLTPLRKELVQTPTRFPSLAMRLCVFRQCQVLGICRRQMPAAFSPGGVNPVDVPGHHRRRAQAEGANEGLFLA
jgi:hypothetical protein